MFKQIISVQDVTNPESERLCVTLGNEDGSTVMVFFKLDSDHPRTRVLTVDVTRTNKEFLDAIEKWRTDYPGPVPEDYKIFFYVQDGESHSPSWQYQPKRGESLSLTVGKANSTVPGGSIGGSTYTPGGKIVEIKWVDFSTV